MFIRKDSIALASVAIGLGGLMATVGAGFSLRQTVFAGGALLLGKLGMDLCGEAFSKGPFRRVQFRFDLSRLGRAFLDAGIYTEEEIGLVMPDILAHHQRIIFTWLEPNLFYMNGRSQFSEELELAINLKTVRPRKGVDEFFLLPDRLELRSTTAGYEFVLISSEQQNEHPRPYQLPGLVLFRLPYTLFSALQGPEQSWKRHEKACAVMKQVAELKYRKIEEVRDGWDYEGRYGDFRWWFI